jgi:transcriptional regulator with XRE-family HTH domain
VADSLHSDAYRSIIRNLREVREQAGVQQTELSALLGKAHNYISRIETSERRVGIVELIVIASGLGLDPVELFARIIRDVPPNLE